MAHTLTHTHTHTHTHTQTNSSLTRTQVLDMGIDTMLLCFCEAQASGRDNANLPLCFRQMKDANDDTLVEAMGKAKRESEKRKAANAQQPPVHGKHPLEIDIAKKEDATVTV